MQPTETPSSDITARRLRAVYFIATCCISASGVGILVYQGPGRAVIRGWGGDVLVVVWLVALLGVVWPHARVARLVGVFLFACVLEGAQALQLLDPDAPRWLRVVLGATFDLWDLVAYAFGAVLSIVMEWCFEKVRNRR